MDQEVQVFQFLPLVLFGQRIPWLLSDQEALVIQVDQWGQEDQVDQQYHYLLLDLMFLKVQEVLGHPFLPVHLGVRSDR